MTQHELKFRFSVFLVQSYVDGLHLSSSQLSDVLIKGTYHQGNQRRASACAWRHSNICPSVARWPAYSCPRNLDTGTSCTGPLLVGGDREDALGHAIIKNAEWSTLEAKYRDCYDAYRHTPLPHPRLFARVGDITWILALFWTLHLS